MDLMGNRIIGFWVKKSPLHVRFSPPICFTLPETNIAPENGWLEEEFPFGARPIFRGELLASGRVIVLARGVETPTHRQLPQARAAKEGEQNPAAKGEVEIFVSSGMWGPKFMGI